MACKGNVSWERFEEQTKLAFVANPANSRFFLKTRVTANKKVKVVARVSHRSTKPTSASPSSSNERNGTVKYATADTTNLYRLTKLLRFAMQEVLGPSRASPTLAPPDSKAAESLAPASQKKKKNKKKSR